MSQRISSVHNPRIRKAASLRRRDERDAQRRCLIDGTREIGRALDAGVQIDELFVSESRSSDDAEALIQRVIDRGVTPCYVTPSVFAKLAFGERDEGLVATAHPPNATLASLRLPPEPLVAVLAGVEKPGNIGAVLRSADAAGVSALIVADGRTDLFNPNVIRASLGAVFSISVAVATSHDVLAWLRAQKFQIYAARVDAPRPYFEVQLTGRTAILLGSEATGLDHVWIGDDIQPVALPMHGVIDSLNVSVAAGILFYEVVRQRRSAKK